MKRIIAIPQVCGLLLVFLSTIVLSGWLSNEPHLISIVPTSITQVFNAALCFLIIGIGFVIPRQNFNIQNKYFLVAGIAVFIISALTLSEYIFKKILLIDTLFVNSFLDHSNPYPGRMGYSTATTLLFTSLLLMFWQKRRVMLARIYIKTLIFFVFAMGFLNILGYCLGLEFLYHSHVFVRTSLYTAFNFIIISLSLASLIKEDNRPESLDEHQERKILFVTITTLIVVALIAALSGFSVFSQQSQMLLQNELEQALLFRTNILESEVNSKINSVNSIVNNRRFDVLLKSEQHMDDLKLLFRNEEFTGVKLLKANKELIYTRGHFTQPNFIISRLPNEKSDNAFLVWNNGWRFQLTKKIFRDNLIGILIVEMPLVEMNRLYESNYDYSFNNFSICGMRDDKTAICAPQQLKQNPIIESIHSKNFNTNLIQAFLGHRGNNTFIDQDNHLVYTVFSPIKNLGLALSISVDTVELYQPVRKQLEIVIPIFLFAVGIGVLLLFWQVSPLIRKIIISEKKTLDSNKRLRASESRFRAAFDNAAIGMALVSLDGRWLRVNPSLCEILGYGEEELLTMRVDAITNAEDAQEENYKLSQLRIGKLANVRIEKRFITKNKYPIWVLVNSSLIRNTNNEPIYFISQIQNIDLQKQAEERLKELAYHDPLTGLDNRAEIEKNITAAIFACQINHQGFALIILDLDHFKEVNDSYGHDVGDLLLKEVAKRLRSVVRRSDKVGRLGGDEFVIMLIDIADSKNIYNIAQKILKIMSSPLILEDGISLKITTSIGISIYPEDGLSMETLMKHADIALYCAKEFGKNNFQFFGGVDVTRPQSL